MCSASSQGPGPSASSWRAQEIADTCHAECPGERLPRGPYHLDLPNAQPFVRITAEVPVLDFVRASILVAPMPLPLEPAADEEALLQVAMCYRAGEMLSRREGEGPADSAPGKLLVIQPTPADPSCSAEASALHCNTPSRSTVGHPTVWPAHRPQSSLQLVRQPGITYMHAAKVGIYPPDLDGPALYYPLDRIVLELRMQPDDADRGHYTVFEPHQYPKVRPGRRDWVLSDYAADAASASQVSIRSVLFITRPMRGYPIPQLVLTPTGAPVPWLAIPFDLRAMNHGVITACIPPVLELQELPAHIAAGAPVERPIGPGLALPAPLIDSMGGQHERISAPLARYEWLRPHEGLQVEEHTAEAAAAVVPHPQSAAAIGGHSAHTMATQRFAVITGEATTLLGRERGLQMPRGRPTCVCKPDHFFEDACSVKDTLQFELTRVRGPYGHSSFAFTVMLWHRAPQRMIAGAHWTLNAVARAAEAFTDEPTRELHVLQTPLQGFATPQVVLTPLDVERPCRIIPVDLRSINGPVFPAPIEPSMTVDDIFGAIRPFVTTDVATQLRVGYQNPTFVRDQHGAIHTSLPANIEHIEWLAIHASAYVEPLPETSTTSTTTLMQGPEPATISLALVHGRQVFRTPPVLLAALDPTEALARLVSAYARQRRIPDGGVIQMLSAAPLRAANGCTTIPFVLTHGSEEGVTVVLDATLYGQGMHSVEVKAGVYAEDLLKPEHHAARITVLCNGLALQALRRPLESGDYVQYVPYTLRGQSTVTAATFFLHQTPALRLWTLPVAFPPLTHVRGVQSEAVVANAARAFLRFFQGLERNRGAILGQPEVPGTWQVWVLSARRLPLVFAMPSRVCPTLEEAEPFLRGTGAIPADELLHMGRRYINLLDAAFIAVRPDDSFWTMLSPVPDALEFSHVVAISRRAPTAPHAFQTLPHTPHTVAVPPTNRAGEVELAQRAAFALVMPATQTAAATAARRQRSRPPSSSSMSMSLLQTKAQLLRPLGGPGPDLAVVTEKAPYSMPTPFGRRRLLLPTENRTSADARRTATVLRLQNLLPRPAAAITWEVTPDIKEAALEGHDLAQLSACPPPALASSIYAAVWNNLPPYEVTEGVQALFIFTDGSYFPGKDRASWAVVVLALQNGELRRVGVLAGPCAIAILDGRSASSPSAYDGELEAILHAQAIVCAWLRLPIGPSCCSRLCRIPA